MNIILMLGVINIILVFLQLLVGLRVIRFSFKIHKFLGIVLACTATLHAILAITAD